MSKNNILVVDDEIEIVDAIEIYVSHLWKNKMEFLM